MFAQLASAALPQSTVQEFYVPMPEANLQTALKAIDTTGTPVGNDIKTTIAIAVGSTNTLIVFDQWEDGYENDINSPAQSTTQIWGDGNVANGFPPGFPSDVLLPGNVIILTNVVSLPRNPAVYTYDGRDRIAATKAVVITRVGWGVAPGTVLMSGAEVYDTTRWGTSFEIPVGTNTTPTIQNFSYSSLFIMASQNGTVVQVDINGDGTVDLTTTLNRGDNYFVNGGVQSGATVTASKPVQVDELTGRIGSTYQSRTFAIRPIDQWDSNYYAPVGTTLASETHNVFLFNPYTTNLSIRCSTRTSTTDVSVPANSNYKFAMPLNSGARFYTTNSVTFYAVGANDTGGTASGNATHDWGYSLLPASALTTVALAGWAPGADGSPPSGNGSPLWVTPTRPTTLYVNYSGNPTNGPYTAPNGQKYNTNFTLTAFQSQTIYSPAGVNNLSGARLFTVDGTTFTAAWGEDSSKAGAGSPYMDVGTSIIPFPVPVIYKSTVLKIDVNGDGQVNPGDTLEYTIRVSNQGMLALGDVLVLDPLPNTLAYVANSTTLNGVAVADNMTPPAGTIFPLDESGLTLQNIPVGGYSEIKYSTLVNSGATSVTNYVAVSDGEVVQTNSTTIPIVSTGTPTPTCSMAFSDSTGSTVSTYAPNGSIYVTIGNSSLNTLPGTVETVVVLVKNNSNADQEYLTLTETGVNTGVFRNSSPLPSSSTAGASQQDGTLYALGGQTLQVDLVNSICTSAFAIVSLNSASKKLYLSDPNQALDRVDPVASNDATTTNTVELGGTGGTTAGSTNRLVVASSDDAREVNNVVNISGQTMQIDNSDKDWNGFRFTGITIPAGASITSATLELQSDENNSSGSPQVALYAEKSSSPATFTTANNSIQNRIRTTATVNWSLGSWTAGTRYSSPSIASIIQELVSTYGGLTNAPIVIILDNLTSSAVRNLRTFDFAAANAPKLTVNWTVSGGTAITGTTFTQTPSFCSDFSMPSGGAVTITNYLSSITGTLPANPDVTAVLKYGTTAFIGFGSPTYNSINGTLVWSGTLSSNVIVTAGQAITFAVTNNSATYSFKMDYDSSSKPSSISLPTTTIINVDSVGFYTSAYPGATVAASALSGQTLYLRTTISDPFGSNDVNRCLLTITDPSASVTSVTLSNAQLVASDTCSRTYEYTWLAGAAIGAYLFRVDAFEGTEGITNSRLASIFVDQLDLGTPSTTEFTYGGNGVQTNSYTAGGNIWIRVVDLNRNTSASTTNTITALVTVSTGDREPITLSETGTNTGVFTGFLPSSISSVTTSNGTLNLAYGATLTVTYTDATDATDVTSDTSTIKPAVPSTAAVSVLKTLVSPVSGLAVVGSTVEFNIEVANSGDLALNTVTLTDTNLSTQLLLTSASLSPNTTGTNGANVVSNVWNNLGPLAVGASTNITVSFRVLTAGNLTNTVRISGSATAGPSSASVTGYRTALAIGKSIVSPVPGPADIGSTVVFRIALTNTGTTTISSLPLEDNYSPGALQYVSATTTPTGAGGGQILWANLGPLAAGAYTTVDVTFTAVGVCSPTANNAAVTYATDSSGNAVQPVQSSTNLTITGGSIGTSVWFDANANGINDSGDSPLSGVIVFIDANNDTIRQASETFATTDSNGSFLLPSLAAGTYVVRVDTSTLPSGVVPTYDLDGTGTANVASTVTLTSGQNRTDVNFGYTGSGSIGNYVWYDTDGDGVQDSAESGLAGVRVFIDDNGNGRWETGEPYQTTSAAGLYSFEHLVAGSYNIAVDFSTLPAGSTCTGDPDSTKNGATTVTLSAGQNVTTADFGFQGNYSLGNWVFDDWNNNGTRDVGENGINGVVLKLFAASAGNPTGTELATQTSQGNGYYRFDGLMPGSYVVVVDQASSAILTAYVSSTGTNTDLTLAGDGKDHGKDMPVNAGAVVGGIASVAVTLGTNAGVSLQPLEENVANSSPTGQYGPGGDANDNLILDFGFTPTYSIGNRVFTDNGAGAGTVCDGIQNGSEAGIAGVGVQLKNSLGTVLATTNTDANGYYRFDDLPAGSYSIFLPATNFSGSAALLGMVSSTSTKAGDKGDKGLDESDLAANGISSASVTLGPSLATGETDIGSGAGAHGPTGDTYDDLTIDFGMVAASSTCSIGSLVWHDANNNGLWASGESGIANVTVEVWSSDSGGNLLGTSAVATTTTASDGTYWVGGLNPGMYRVKIPSSNFGTGQPLEVNTASSSTKDAADDDIDNDNNGLQTAAGLAVLSPVITLSLGGEPTDVTESGPGASLDNNVVDANGNMTVDFGFYSPATDQANLCSLGSLVWKDANNNGVRDSGEPGIAGVLLELWQVNINTGVSNYWGSTLSGSDGTYFFHDLPSGTNWLVHIPASNFSGSGALTTYPKTGGTPVNADNQTDNDNNGVQPGGVGTEVWSHAIGLTAGGEPENNLPSVPTGEFGSGYGQDNSGSYVDANGDMTVDFGFTPTYSLGNRVYHDPDNDGQPDLDNLDEGGFAGVGLKVFAADESGNPTGSALGTATTDSEGFYRFDGLVAGTYVVVVDKAHFAELDGYVSVTGWSTDFAVSGDIHDHGKDTPLGVGSVLPGGIASAPVTLGPGLQPVGEGTAPGSGGNGPTGDANDNLVIDFGFAPLYSVGNRVFLDANNNGILDGGETGIASVTVKLFAADASGSPTGSALGTTNTDSSGYYRFDGMAWGTYVVVVDKPHSATLSGYVSSTGASTDTATTGDKHDHGNDTPLGDGSVLPGGIASSPVEFGMELVAPLSEPDVSSAAGAHGPNDDIADNLVMDFGFAPAATITGSVRVDVNGNGVFNDEDTNGISGVTVQLQTSSHVLVATTTTAGDGTYSFTELAPGDYIIVETDKTGWISTADTASANDNQIPITLTSGQAATGNNFLDVQPGSIAGSVLVDTDGDGNFDSDETTGISGITMVLETSLAVPVATNVTSSSGSYLFTEILPGNYVVVATDPAGWTSTADTAGGNDNRIPLTLTSGMASTGNNFLDKPVTNIWNPSGSLTCNVTNATGYPPGNGYSVVNYDGYLDVQATTEHPFTIQLVSFSGSSPGAAENFDYHNPFTWTIATASLGVLNFDPAKVAVDTNQFANNLDGGTFSVVLRDNAVLVVFTPNQADATQSTLTPTSSIITADGSSTQVLTVQAKDANGNNVTIGGSTVTITQFSGTGTIGSVTDNGDGTYTAIVTSPTAIGSGVFVATLRGAPVESGTGSQTQATVNYTPGRATKLVFTTSPVNVTAGQTSGTITVEQQDQYGNPVTAGSDLTVTLSSSSSGPVTFSPSSPLTIPSGSSSVSFTYQDTKAGTPTLTAASSGLTDGTQAETVNKATPTISGVTSTSCTYGASTVALNGVVSATGSVYPANGETVSITIDSVTVPATISGGAGDFSLNFPTATIPYSGTPYTITYAYAGNDNLNAAPNNTSTTLTVNQRPVDLSGSRFYDGTYTAYSSNLGVTNKVTGDDLTLSGSVTLASRDIGSRSVSDFSSLTLGGAAAGNYTKTSATGSVTISDTKSDTGVTTIDSANSADFNLYLNAGKLLASNDPTDGSINGTGTNVVNASATLAGTGKVGAVTVNSQGTISAGDTSVGTLTTASEIWASGGTNLVQIANATGTKGTTGWDWLDIAGGLDISATTGSKFTIALSTPAEGAANFSSGSCYAWPIATASGGITDFDPAKFTVDASAFKNTLSTYGTFSVSNYNKSIYVVYTPDCVTPAKAQNWLDPDNITMHVTFANNAGLVSVQAQTMVNCSVTCKAFNITGEHLTPDQSIPSIRVRIHLPPGTTSIELVAIREAGKQARLNLLAGNSCGMDGGTDPTILNLTIGPDGILQTLLDDIPQVEHHLQVFNGSPGLRSLSVAANGQTMPLSPLADSSNLTADLAGILAEGENTLVFTATGTPGATAVIVLSDTPLSATISAPMLTARQTADGLELTWLGTAGQWQLQTTPAIGSAWENHSTAPSVQNGLNRVIEKLGASNRFYRLQAASASATTAAPSSASITTALPAPAQAQQKQNYGDITW